MQQIGDKRLPDRTAEEIKAAADDPSKIIEAELPGVKLRNANWDAKQVDADTVEFTRTLQSAGLQIVKRYKIAKAEGDKPGYHLTLDIELKNVGQSALSSPISSTALPACPPKVGGTPAAPGAVGEPLACVTPRCCCKAKIRP